MFDNIGSKIKGLASAVTWAGIILSIISGIAMIASSEGLLAFPAILVIAVGSLISWLSSLTLYGFGQLIENSDIIANEYRKKNGVPSTTHTTTTNTKDAEPSETPAQNDTTNGGVVPVKIREGKYECPKCGCRVKMGEETCICHSKLDWSKATY